MSTVNIPNISFESIIEKLIQDSPMRMTYSWGSGAGGGVLSLIYADRVIVQMSVSPRQAPDAVDVRDYALCCLIQDHEVYRMPMTEHLRFARVKDTLLGSLDPSSSPERQYWHRLMRWAKDDTATRTHEVS